MKLSFFNTKRAGILLHVAAWLFVFSLPYLLTSNSNENHPIHDATGFFLLNALSGLSFVATFYFNAFVLTPGFVYERKFMRYFAILLIIFVLIVLMNRFLYSLFITGRPYMPGLAIAIHLIPFILVVAISTTYQFIRDKTNADRLVQQ